MQHVHMVQLHHQTHNTVIVTLDIQVRYIFSLFVTLTNFGCVVIVFSSTVGDLASACSTPALLLLRRPEGVL